MYNKGRDVKKIADKYFNDTYQKPQSFHKQIADKYIPRDLILDDALNLTEEDIKDIPRITEEELIAGLRNLGLCIFED